MREGLSSGEKRGEFFFTSSFFKIGGVFEGAGGGEISFGAFALCIEMTKGIEQNVNPGLHFRLPKRGWRHGTNTKLIHANVIHLMYISSLAGLNWKRGLEWDENLKKGSLSEYKRPEDCVFPFFFQLNK